MVSASPACSWSRGKCLQQLLRHNTGGRRAHDFSRETKTLPVSSASEVQTKPGRWGVVRASQLLRQLGDRSSSSRRQRCGDSFGDAEDPPLRALDFGSPDHGFLISASSHSASLQSSGCVYSHWLCSLASLSLPGARWGCASVPPAAGSVLPWPSCLSASHSLCLLSTLVFQPSAFPLNSPPSFRSSPLYLCRPPLLRAFTAPNLPSTLGLGRAFFQLPSLQAPYTAGSVWDCGQPKEALAGAPPRGSQGASSLHACVTCVHTLLANFCRARSLIQMPRSDWGGACGMPAISPRTITLSKWGKPTINSRRQPTADLLPETIGPRLLLTPAPLSLSCQNSIFLYASCCVTKPGLQQQITTNLKKQREVYSVTVLETRCPKSRCQQG